MTNPEPVLVFPDAATLFAAAAKDFETRAINAVKAKGLFDVVLAGGNTPKAFYEAVTRLTDYKNRIPWQYIRFFFGDERYVPADDKQSNYHLAYEYLFSKAPINPESIYRIPTEFEQPDAAASAYDSLLRKVLRLADNTLLPFDLVYLGLGDDAHTASLMPASAVVKHAAENPLQDTNHPLAAALQLPASGLYRITLTPNAINHSQQIIFLVNGANKATAVWEALAGPRNPAEVPAQLIHCAHGSTLWYLDQLAASQLSVATLQQPKSTGGKGP